MPTKIETITLTNSTTVDLPELRPLSAVMTARLQAYWTKRIEEVAYQVMTGQSEKGLPDEPK